MPLGQVKVARQAQAVRVHVREVEHSVRVLRLRGRAVVRGRELEVLLRGKEAEERRGWRRAVREKPSRQARAITMENDCVDTQKTKVRHE